MANCTKIHKLVNTGALNKKAANNILQDILAEICCYYMEPLSSYVYKTIANQTIYNTFCSRIFTDISLSVNKAAKEKTSEGFVSELLVPINRLKDDLDNIHSKKKILEDVPENSELLDSLIENSSVIFNRFYKRKRRRTKRKEVGNGRK